MEKSPEARTGWPNDEQIDQQSGRCRKARAHILSLVRRTDAPPTTPAELEKRLWSSPEKVMRSGPYHGCLVCRPRAFRAIGAPAQVIRLLSHPLPSDPENKPS
jgi:hypothetical protein